MSTPKELCAKWHFPSIKSGGVAVQDITLRLRLSLALMSLKVPKANNVQLFKEGYKVMF